MARLSEYYSDPPDVPSSIWTMFAKCSKEHKDDVALTVMHQQSAHLSQLRLDSSQGDEEACLQWTFGDLRQAARLLALGFHKQGVKRGTTMVTLIPNGIECAILLWVSAILQLTLAPLDPRLLDTGREQQLAEYLKRLKPAVVVVPDGAGVEAMGEALRGADMKTALRLSLTESKVDGWLGLASIVSESDLKDAALNEDPALEQNGDRVGIILFTSGTSTGQPKGCPRTVRNLLSGATADFAFPDVPDRLIVHTPNSGAICQAFLFMCGYTGKHVIIPAATFSPAAALDAIEQYKAELLVAIPIMSRMFETELAGRSRDVSALKEVAIGGDMVTSDAKEKFEKLFPMSRVVVGHGMTEGHSLVGWRGYGIPTSYPQYHSILGIGYAQQGALVRVCDESRRIVARGEAGELHLGGPFVIERYLENAQSEAFYRDDKGRWMNTGDRAIMDEHGVIFIIGRTKDIIKRVGMSLSPAVVESVLNSMDGTEASVFGVPHPDYGEVPLAVVKASVQTADASQMRKGVTDSLGADYALQDIKSLAEIGLDTWPLTPSNKIAKHELRSAYMRSLATE